MKNNLYDFKFFTRARVKKKKKNEKTQCINYWLYKFGYNTFRHTIWYVTIVEMCDGKCNHGYRRDRLWPFERALWNNNFNVLRAFPATTWQG